MYQQTIMDNGLRLITSSMPYTKSVSIGFFIGTGSRYETEAQAGISHFIEHLCFRGTAQRPSSREISTAIEGVGGILNGGTDKELTIYWCKVARPHLAIALDVLADMLLNSRFDPGDVEKERQVIIEEINMCHDSPSQRAALLIDELLWYGHPLGRDIAGSRESVSAISREMLLGYLSSQYQPGNTVLAIAGDVRHPEMEAAASRALGGWRAAEPRSGYLAYRQQPGRRVLVEPRETEQVQVCLALPGLPLLHPQRFALDLLNVILGEGMSSRLFAEVRDKLGLVYSISSYADHLLDTGALNISAGVDPKNLRVAIGAIMEQLARLKEQIPGEEIAKAKELSKGRLLLRMEDSRNVSAWVGVQQILNGSILSVDQVIAMLDAITAGELRQVAAELLVAEGLRLAVVGPVAPDEPLEELLKL